MALIRNFIADSIEPNVINLNWDQPIGFNNSVDDEIIFIRTVSHFVMELENTAFPTKVSENRGIEIFRGKNIAGIDTGTISVLGSTLTDTGASFPTSPSLKGRILRDSDSNIFRIESNTATTITVESGSPANGKYIVLADFSCIERDSESFEIDIRTEVGTGFIKNLVKVIDGSLQVRIFEEDELVNLIFQDGAGTRFIIKSNTEDTLSFFDSSVTPVIGPGMTLLKKFNNSVPLSYEDNFKTESEADSRTGTGLRDNRFYYYTGITKPESGNVAQAELSPFDSNTSTQSSSISIRDRNFGDRLYKLWPTLYRRLDETEDLEDLMSIFGAQFNILHSLIETYTLQNASNVFVNALVPLADQFGLPSISSSLGIDTLRRIACDMIDAWRLKGTKEGIALYIRILTTWDVTNGSADFDTAINDDLTNADALRFFSATLDPNSRITQTDPFVAGGRFAVTTPGIVIPGFFTFREFVIELPNIALFIGQSKSFSVSANSTTMEDTTASFGAIDSLVGNFLFPNQEEINDVFEIIANTSTTITVRGIINNLTTEGTYIVLSPLNTNRFIALNKLLPLYIPFGTKSGFNFTCP